MKIRQHYAPAQVRSVVRCRPYAAVQVRSTLLLTVALTAIVLWAANGFALPGL